MSATLAADRLQPIRDQLDAWRADTEWHRERSERLEVRRRTRPEIRDLFERFTSGIIDLEEFRREFDARTRKEWGVWGLAGMSGAMVLNKLAKHIADLATLEQELRVAFAVPADEAQAEAQLRRFHDYLGGLIERGDVSLAQVQSARFPVFCSIGWHMADPAEWPIAYSSIRVQLEAWGLYVANYDDPPQLYLELRRVEHDVAGALGLSVEDLEGLAYWANNKASPQPDPANEKDRPLPTRRIWLIAPGHGAAQWDAMRESGVIGIYWSQLGDLSSYKSRDEIKAALTKLDWGKRPTQQTGMCWSFVHDIRPGDLVFAKKGRRAVVGYGVVESDYSYDPAGGTYPNRRKVRWIESGERAVEQHLARKTLTEITDHSRLLAELARVFEIEDLETAGGVGDDPPGEGDDEPRTETDVPFTLEDADQELFLDRSDIEELLELLRSRKNLVLQGAPGTGKTYLAARLAWLLLGQRDPSRETLEVVQFHQAYSYEDFVQGYRPAPDGGFVRRDGPFLRLCDRAHQEPDTPHVLIIDEINRGNLAKILGELMLLIERDKRSSRWATRLAYSTEDDPPFHVPPNVYVIGTMNTADRSLALVDYALRRRFIFVDVEPALGTATFRQHLEERGVPGSMVRAIVQAFGELNAAIASDSRLGPGYRIGHSFLCDPRPTSGPDGGDGLDAWLQRIVQREIAPLLAEYWFDDPESVERHVGALLDALP